VFSDPHIDSTHELQPWFVEFIAVGLRLEHANMVGVAEPPLPEPPLEELQAMADAAHASASAVKPRNAIMTRPPE
jgi:hypothetical protein